MEADLKEIKLNSIPTEGTKVEFDPAEILRSVEVDPYAEIDKPPTAIEIHTGGKVAPIMTLDNFTMFIGKAKSKKTFLLTVFLAVVIIGGWIWDFIKCVLPAGKNFALYFDSEQSPYDLNRVIKRALKLAGRDAVNFKAYGLRKFKPSERLALIEYAIYNTPNLGIVFIDGIRDLLSKGINDEEEATELTSKFLKWTAELNIHIVTVLHQNKTDQNARGVIGTEMLNKAETTISIKVDDHDKDTSIVSCEMSRNIGFEDFAFRINEHGMPEPCDMPENETCKPKTVNPDQVNDETHFTVLAEIFKTNPNPKYRELWQTIKVVFGTYQTRLGDNKAKDFLAYYQQQEWISKNGTGYKYERAIF